MKSALNVSFDIIGLSTKNLYPPPQWGTNSQWEVLKWLRDSMRRKVGNNSCWVLHHENAPVHASLALQHFLASKNPIRLNSSPRDVFLFRASFLHSKDVVFTQLRTSRPSSRRCLERFRLTTSSDAWNHEKTVGSLYPCTKGDCFVGAGVN